MALVGSHATTNFRVLCPSSFTYLNSRWLLYRPQESILFQHFRYTESKRGGKEDVVIFLHAPLLKRGLH